MVCCRIESAIHCTLLLHELQAKNKKYTTFVCLDVSCIFKFREGVLSVVESVYVTFLQELLTLLIALFCRK